MNWNHRIGQRLKLRDLHYLMTVVQAGSMAKAAPRLTVSQPVLSKTIAELELLLGVRLLDRSPHGVVPTTYGCQLLAASHAIFDELRLGIKEIEHLSDPKGGELSVGSNEASTIGIVPATIERIRREHPRMVVRVVLMNTSAEQHRALRERRIDFAIGRISQTSHIDEFETELLFDQQQVVVAGTQNAWTQRARVELTELIHEPWVLPSIETTSGQLAADVFRLSGLPVPRARVVTSSFQLNRGLLERGPFLALMPATTLSSFSRYSCLQPVAVSLPRQHGSVGIIKLRNRAPSPLANRFIEIARLLACAAPGRVGEGVEKARASILSLKY
jgi:DNA-binding transcriptional LysR family regulator